MSVRVLIADDQELVRTGFRMILDAEPDIETIGEAVNGLEAVALARQLRPDVVLMDIRMPELDGIAAAREITQVDPADAAPPRVLMLTTFDLDEYVYDALRAGASGFLLKDLPAAQLVAGVRTVNHGDALLAPTITRRLIEEFTSATHTRPPPGLDELTPREHEILHLVAQGLSNAEIAAQLIIGETTVKTHVTRLLTKLNLRDRVQAVVLAYETGIVTPTRRPPRQ
jgi:DNA-binding NarL/FixJ family response regulator